MLSLPLFQRGFLRCTAPRWFVVLGGWLCGAGALGSSLVHRAPPAFEARDPHGEPQSTVAPSCAVTFCPLFARATLFLEFLSAREEPSARSSLLCHWLVAFTLTCPRSRPQVAWLPPRTPASLRMPENLARRLGRAKPIAHDKTFLLGRGARGGCGKARCVRTATNLKKSRLSMWVRVAIVLCAVLLAGQA